MGKPNPQAEISDEEAAKRAEEAIRRSFSMPHAPHKAIIGTTPRAKAQANRKATKGSPKSK
jgi:hypothetical protein